MSKSNCIPVFDVGNNIVSSGLTIAGLGGGLSATSGGFSKYDTDLTDTVITHNLGKIPTNITFTTFYYQGGGFVVLNSASYNSSGNKGTYLIFELYTGGRTQLGTNENFVIKVFSFGTGNTFTGTVSAINSTTFTISYTRNGTLGSDNFFTQWNATG